MKKYLKKALVPLLCYAFALAVYLIVCTVQLARLNALQPQTLTLASFAHDGIVVVEAENGVERFVTAGGDPQLIYAPGEAFRAGRITFAATANKPIGELVLFYTTQQGGAFSNLQKVWATLENGEWVFDLGGKTVYALRLDPGTQSGVVWQVGQIVLNAPQSALSLYLPTPYQAILLAAIPAFAAAVVLVAAREVLRQLEQRKKRKL